MAKTQKGRAVSEIIEIYDSRLLEEHIPVCDTCDLIVVKVTMRSVSVIVL